MNIVFGGTFNPPTIAHEKAIQTVLSALQVDRFIIVPVGNKYHLKTIEEDEHRFSMLELISNKLGVELSRIELDSKSYSGTYSLLKKLNMENTKFLIGSDNLREVRNWIEPEKLIVEFGLVVLSRKDDCAEIIKTDKFLSKYKENIIIINDFDFDISSTMFRKTLNFDLVSEEVKKYIKNNKLYGGNHVS